MELNNPGFIDIPEGVYYGQNERTNELNWRISERMDADRPMKPNYDPRPVNTKYALFPVIDRVKPIEEHAKMYQEHNVETNFIPCTHRAHYSQDRILQKYETTNEYKPSFESDLYKVTVPQGAYDHRNEADAHSALFQTYTYATQSFDTSIGANTFHNATRTQLRNM